MEESHIYKSIEVTGTSEKSQESAIQNAIAKAARTLLAAPPDRNETRATAERFTWETNGAALEAHLSGLVQR